MLEDLAAPVVFMKRLDFTFVHAFHRFKGLDTTMLVAIRVMFSLDRMFCFFQTEVTVNVRECFRFRVRLSDTWRSRLDILLVRGINRGHGD